MSASQLPTAPQKFTGWIGKDKDSVGRLEHGEYDPKPFTESDVDIAITHCGICGSDLHTLRSGWGESMYPQVVGHEIVGTAIRVGKNVSHIKVGDRVGVGAQSGSCENCEECNAHREPYCTKGMVGTYNGKFADGKSWGGYADFSRVPGRFVVPIPAGLPSSIAAPMLCGGVTVYSPLKQYGAGTERKNVGIVGIGGLGHFGLMFAKAMGANVTAISHSESKKADAEKMGATTFIATHGGKDVAAHRGSLELIIVTTDDARMPLNDYLSLLKPHGVIAFVGVPEEAMPPTPLGTLIFRNINMTGSLIGSPSVIREMLEIAASQKIHTWVQEWPLENVNEALVAMEEGKPRYRYVLVNEKHKHLVPQ